MKLKDLDAITAAFAKAFRGGNPPPDKKPRFHVDNPNGSPSYNRIISKSYKQADKKEQEFMRWNDDLLLQAILMKRRDQRVEDVLLSTELYKSRLDFFRNESELSKAMTTGGSGSGAEWVPTGFSTQLIELFQQELKVASKFMRMAMAQNPMEVPRKNAFSIARKGSEGTDPTDSSVGTAKVTLSAVKMIVDLPYTYELEEDAAFSLVPVLRDDIVNALARGEEQATIDGDTAATHMDSDVTSAEDVRKSYNGLRKLTLATAKVNLSTFNYENLISVKKALGKYGSNPADLVWIYGPAVEAKLLSLKDSSNNPIVSRVNDFGQDLATIRTGIIRTLMGSEAINSEFIREDLDANGVYNATDGGKTIIICVNKRGFMYGDRGTLKVEQDANIRSQTRFLVASKRTQFKDRWDAANNTIVALGRNIAV